MENKTRYRGLWLTPSKDDKLRRYNFEFTYEIDAFLDSWLYQKEKARRKSVPKHAGVYYERKTTRRNK